MSADSEEISQFLKSTRFKFVSAFRNEIESSRCNLHSHPYFEIVMHSENRGTVWLETGHTTTFQPGGFIVHPPDIQHVQQTENSGADLCILVDSSIAPPKSLLRLFSVPGGSRPWLAADVMSLLEYSRNQTEIAALANDLRVSSLMISLLDNAGGNNTTSEKSAGRSLAFEADRIINRDYANLNGVAELADRLCVSASHLRHVYRQYHDTGVKQRLIKVRIDRACDLLVGSTLPIKTVSQICGFANDRQFSTRFTGDMTCSPGEYRRRYSVTRAALEGVSRT